MVASASVALALLLIFPRPSAFTFLPSPSGVLYAVSMLCARFVQEYTQARWYCLVPLTMTLVLHFYAFI